MDWWNGLGLTKNATKECGIKSQENWRKWCICFTAFVSVSTEIGLVVQVLG